MCSCVRIEINSFQKFHSLFFLPLVNFYKVYFHIKNKGQSQKNPIIFCYGKKYQHTVEPCKSTRAAKRPDGWNVLRCQTWNQKGQLYKLVLSQLGKLGWNSMVLNSNQKESKYLKRNELAKVDSSNFLPIRHLELIPSTPSRLWVNEKKGKREGMACLEFKWKVDSTCPMFGFQFKRKTKILQPMVYEFHYLFIYLKIIVEKS